MKLRIAAAALLSGALLSGQAQGAPSFGTRLAKLERQVRVLTNFELHQRIRQQIITADMAPSGRYWQGEVTCPDLGVVSGGGWNWGIGESVHGDWVANVSQPSTNGLSWEVTLYNGGSGQPTLPPQVYAVCVRLVP